MCLWLFPPRQLAVSTRPPCLINGAFCLHVSPETFRCRNKRAHPSPLKQQRRRLQNRAGPPHPHGQGAAVAESPPSLCLSHTSLMCHGGGGHLIKIPEPAAAAHGPGPPSAAAFLRYTNIMAAGRPARGGACASVTADADADLLRRQKLHPFSSV